MELAQKQKSMGEGTGTNVVSDKVGTESPLPQQTSAAAICDSIAAVPAMSSVDSKQTGYTWTDSHTVPQKD